MNMNIQVFKIQDLGFYSFKFQYRRLKVPDFRRKTDDISITIQD